MQRDAHQEQRGQGRFRLSTVGAFLAFLALMALTLGFVHQERADLVKSIIDQRLASMGRTTMETLRLSVENLRSVSSVLVYFSGIDYAQFKGIAAGYFESDPALLIMEWQPVVPGRERQRFERTAQVKVARGFRLWEPDESGRPIPAKTREEHVPVMFMLPREEIAVDDGTLGLDLAWSLERMDSKWIARDTGRAQASGLFPVITGPGSDYRPLGFAVTLPIYRDGYVPDNLADRKQRVLGYMAGVYAIEKLLKTQIDSLRSEGFSLEVHDRIGGNGNSLRAETGTASPYQGSMSLDVYGNSLMLKLTASEAFVSRQFQPLWVVLPFALISFGLLVFIFLRQLERKNLSLMSAQAQLERLNAKLLEQSQRDPLTGLFNRRAFIDAVEREVDRMQRYPASNSLLLLDLDHFKSINDRWGHPVGDAVLIAFAECCRGVSRSIDVIGRIGGEEFAILLLKTNRDDALLFAERLRKATMALRVLACENGPEISVTVSVGLSAIVEPMPVDAWIRHTDKALYLAKNSGRNCIKE